MKLTELKVNEFIAEVDSPSPAPGGGSVSALVIAQGLSLLRMVSHLTIGKKRFKTLPDDIKADYMNRFEQIGFIKDQIMALVEKDTEAFNQIMAAYQMPKETEEEIVKRNQKIEEATIIATEIPSQTALLGVEALEIAEPMFQYANKNAISDLGVGSLLVDAGVKGAILNVKTNIQGFSNEAFVEKNNAIIYNLEQKLNQIVSPLLKSVNEMLSN